MDLAYLAAIAAFCALVVGLAAGGTRLGAAQ